MWTQVVGKVRLAFSPYMNHWWQVPLYVTARGLTTSPIPYEGETFEIVFDFIEHNLLIEKNDGTAKTLRLAPRSVAEFYAEGDGCAAFAGHRGEDLDDAGRDSKSDPVRPGPHPRLVRSRLRQPVLADPRFGGRDFKRIPRTLHRQGQPGAFFWGSFDLAVTRFSGRRAPEIPGADRITREGYSHEVSSVGWWPGDEMVKEPAFYSYAAPEPSDFPKRPFAPRRRPTIRDLSQFLLRYDDVRSAASPRQALLDFCQSTYEAAATLAKWNRAELEHNA